MTVQVEELRLLLEDLADEVDDKLPLMKQAMDGVSDSDQPLSIFAVFSFFTRVESICLSIFALAKNQEYYSLGILFRSLLEHFVKAQYINYKVLELSDDSIGIDYWVFNREKEEIDYVKALSNSYALHGLEPAKPPIEILKDIGVISKEKSARQIRAKVEQFTYKNMIQYLSNVGAGKEAGPLSLLSKMLPEYSTLSSFVHGGPESANAYELGEDRMNNIVLHATFATLMSRYCLLVLLYQRDKRVEPLLIISQNYLGRFLQTMEQADNGVEGA